MKKVKKLCAILGVKKPTKLLKIFWLSSLLIQNLNETIQNVLRYFFGPTSPPFSLNTFHCFDQLIVLKALQLFSLWVFFH